MPIRSPRSTYSLRSMSTSFTSRIKIPMIRSFNQINPPTFLVPPANTIDHDSFAVSVLPVVQLLVDFLKESEGKLVVLTGAGVSTDSGIPDYRGKKGIYMANPNYKPILFQDFTTDHTFRQRYWARGFLGWPQIERARPNATHVALANLQLSGHLDCIITQNVDGLHQAAMASRVTELHGTLREVNCLSCQTHLPRTEFQEQLSSMNPSWEKFQRRLVDSGERPRTNPDGDVELPEGVSYSTFSYPPCAACGGILKPSVVFFGENIATTVKKQTLAIVEACGALLVIGSSLATFSAFSLARTVHGAGKKVGILNMGPTRGDNLACFRVDASCGDVVPLLLKYLEDPKGI